MTGEIALHVSEAVVTFGGLHALGPISFDVHGGECVVLLGPSGCGKSTLLAALAGLQELSSGCVWTGAANSPPGFVFQDPNLLGWASATDNVALPLTLAGTPADQAKSRAKAALGLVGLRDFVQARPKALSGGMAMRVALARSLVTDPATLLLDEPFGAIDELGRRGLNDVVHAAKRDRGVGVLFVTHSVEEAVYMGDRVLVLSPRPGTIIASIKVPDVPRDAAFLVSLEFSETVAQARRALAQGVLAQGVLAQGVLAQGVGAEGILAQGMTP